jgi:hypothetical protein
METEVYPVFNAIGGWRRVHSIPIVRDAFGEPQTVQQGKVDKVMDDWKLE